MNLALNRRITRLLPAAVALCLAAALIEGRSALASYADVWQEGDTLYIEGDDDVNTVVIVGAEDTVGKLAVYVHKDPWIYNGVANIEVNLAGGDDLLKTAQVGITGDLTVATGGGDDIVLIGGWMDYAANEIAGDIFIGAGSGHDKIAMDNTVVLGNVAIDTGDDDDDVAIGMPLEADWLLSGASSVGNTILGSLDIATGSGLDNVQVSRSHVSILTIDTAGGHDSVLVGDPIVIQGKADGQVWEPSFDGFKTAERDQHTAGNERQLTTDRRSTIRLPPSVDLDELLIDTGSGADYLLLNNILVEVETTIELQDDNDEFLVQESEFNGEFDADGGSDQDAVWNQPSNVYESTPGFHSFEN